VSASSLVIFGLVCLAACAMVFFVAYRDRRKSQNEHATDVDNTERSDREGDA
jgi:hypothetical protein